MRVIVVGAGVFGAWSTKFLADAGHDVTLIDAYGPANGRASSSDHSRVIRSGYGADEIYSRWAADAWHDWEWLARESQRSLVTRTGALFLGDAENRYVRDTYATLTRLGIPADWLDAAEVHARYPQITVDGLGPAVLERDAGVIRASAAVQALVEVLVRTRRVRYLQQQVQALDEAAATLSVRSSDGETFEADAFVFACGPWLPRLFPHSIGDRIRATRQEVLYFGVPPGSDAFSTTALPVWIDFAAGLYGIPDLDNHGFKVGVDRHGPSIDPDIHDRVVSRDIVDRTRMWVGRRFPGMRGAPLVEARVCQYENTSSGDFIIDHHPTWPRCWIVGGGSGHGFKHGPSVGRYAAALVAGEARLNARFALATKSLDAARAVY